MATSPRGPLFLLWGQLFRDAVARLLGGFSRKAKVICNNGKGISPNAA